MNYTHTENLTPHFVSGGPQNAAGQWEGQQFFNNSSSFPLVQTDNSTRLTPENLLLNNKEDCEFFEGQLFGDFNEVGKHEYHDSTNSNSSDKSSSPSGIILNNVPLTSNDISVLNSSINQINPSEVGLSQREIANRRKAQNRAAQRAFRERKEMKLKELEGKLNQSENDKALLVQQLEDIKKQNIVISTENKLLLQNGNTKPIDPSSLTIDQQRDENSSFSFPIGDDVNNNKYYLQPNQLANPEIAYEHKRLTITEVWEYLSEEYDQDLKIDQVMTKIKGLEVCHQHGPAYPLKIVDDFAKKSLAGELD